MTRLVDQSFAQVGDYLLWNERLHVEIVGRAVLGAQPNVRTVVLGAGGDLFVLGASGDRWQNVDTGGDAVAYRPRYRALASSRRRGWGVTDSQAGGLLPREMYPDTGIWNATQARAEAARLNEADRLSRSQIHGRSLL